MEEFGEFDKLKDDINMPDDLSDLGTVSGAPVGPPPESEDERFNRVLQEQKLKNTILRYKAKFGKYLEGFDYKLSDLDNLSIDQLGKLAQEMEIIVSSRNSASFVNHFYFSSVEVLEKIGTGAGFHFGGLSQALANNEAVAETLDELSIKYEGLSYCRPEIRICYLTVQSLIMTHKVNKARIEIETELKKEVPIEILREYEDL